MLATFRSIIKESHQIDKIVGQLNGAISLKDDLINDMKAWNRITATWKVIHLALLAPRRGAGPSVSCPPLPTFFPSETRGEYET